MISLDELKMKLESWVLGLAAPKFYPLTTPLTSVSWNLTAYSDVSAATQLDLSAVFGLPAGIKAVLLEEIARDSAAWGTDGLYFTCGPAANHAYGASVRPKGGDVQESNGPVVVPCDENGDIWYLINASGSNTIDILLRVWGYWI